MVVLLALRSRAIGYVECAESGRRSSRLVALRLHVSGRQSFEVIDHVTKHGVRGTLSVQLHSRALLSHVVCETEPLESLEHIGATNCGFPAP